MFCTENPPRRHPVESVQTKEGNNSDQSTHPPFSIMARLDYHRSMTNNMYCVTLKMQGVQTKVRTTVTDQLQNASVTSQSMENRWMAYNLQCACFRFKASLDESSIIAEKWGALLCWSVWFLSCEVFVFLTFLTPEQWGVFSGCLASCPVLSAANSILPEEQYHTCTFPVLSVTIFSSHQLTIIVPIRKVLVSSISSAALFVVP